MNPTEAVKDPAQRAAERITQRLGVLPAHNENVAEIIREELDRVLEIDGILDALEGKRGGDQQAIALAGLGVVATLLRKNRDYGSSVFQPPILHPTMVPDTALLVRMSDKVARIRTLLSASHAPEVNESLADSFRDLAGYAILWIAVGLPEKAGTCDAASKEAQ